MGALIIIFLLCIVLSAMLGGGVGLAVAFFIIFIGLAIWISVSNSKSRKTEKTAQDAVLEEEAIHGDIDYIFQNAAGTIQIRYIVDNIQKKLFLSETSSDFIRIPLSDIIGCEIITDSEVTGGVGRAVVGGVLAGGAGAVVGATTAKKKITSYKIIIYKKTIEDPSVALTLINSETKTSDIDYKNAVKFAYDVNASIKAIIEQERQVALEKNNPAITPYKTDSTQELRKYKQLLDDGVITKEDFDNKKKQLLGL